MKKLFLYALALFSTLVFWGLSLGFFMKAFGDINSFLDFVAFLLSMACSIAFFKFIKKQLPPWYEKEQDKPDNPEEIQQSIKAIKNSISTIKREYKRNLHDQEEKFTPYSHYDPEERRWRVMGTNHENRTEYILQNSESIPYEATLSREFALDKDPNAISIVHNGKVIGFIAKEHAAILAPVFDKYPDKIRYSFNIWIGQRGQLVGLFVRMHTRFKVAKEEFNAAVKKCEELAYKEG